MEKAKELVPVLPKDDITKLIIKQAVNQLNSASTTIESLRTLMNETASQLPEYPVVMAMKGVGTSLGPQLMAEIGDVSRFTHKGAITAFAGVDPGVNESGSYEQKSVPTSKRGVVVKLFCNICGLKNLIASCKHTRVLVYISRMLRTAKGGLTSLT